MSAYCEGDDLGESWRIPRALRFGQEGEVNHDEAGGYRGGGLLVFVNGGVRTSTAVSGRRLWIWGSGGVTRAWGALVVRGRRLISNMVLKSREGGGVSPVAATDPVLALFDPRLSEAGR